HRLYRLIYICHFDQMPAPSHPYTLSLHDALPICHIVTANKELVAKHGPELERLARNNGVQFLYEASVGGGIPVLGTLLHLLKSRSEEHTSELQSRFDIVCRLLLEKKNTNKANKR